LKILVPAVSSEEGSTHRTQLVMGSFWARTLLAEIDAHSGGRKGILQIFCLSVAVDRPDVADRSGAPT